MIERASEFGASQAAPLTTGDTSFLTAGDMLRQAREAHNLHIEVVAAALKVPVQKMQALEENRIEDLPDPVFARALAASVARALRIDPAPVLAKMVGAKRDGLADADRTMSGNIREHALRSGRGESWSPSKPLMIAVGLLLVAAAAVFWLPQSLFDRVGASLSQVTKSGDGGARPAEAETGPVAAVAPGTVVESVAPNAAPATPSGPAPAAAPMVQDAVPTAAAGADVLSFTARAESWVTVTEPGGKVLLKRSVKAGETVGVSGNLPLSVVVGRASGIDVQVRGKAFDLAPVTRAGGVARFEIKQ